MRRRKLETVFPSMVSFTTFNFIQILCPVSLRNPIATRTAFLKDVSVGIIYLEICIEHVSKLFIIMIV